MLHYIIINHAYAGQLNSFAPLRAVLALHDRGNITINKYDESKKMTIRELVTRGRFVCVWNRSFGNLVDEQLELP
jgi:hypothetical protein